MRRVVRPPGGDDAAAERAQLVGFCARFTGDQDAAEDLAQQTLLEAWRQERQLRDPEARRAWLFRIARNLCLTWGRRRTREASRLLGSGEGGGIGADAERWPPDDFDPEAEFDRDDLARLLDRALALLPPETRRVLVERYVEESPQAEIAGRLGVSEGAVEARLQRGKLALRRALTTELSDEAAAYGLIAPGGSGWRETRIWCAVCGRRRLLARFDRAGGELTLRCPTCNPDYLREPSTNMAHVRSPEVLGGVKGYKPAMSRVMDHACAVFAPALEVGMASCPGCGRPAPLRMELAPYAPRPLWTRWGVHFRCDGCGHYSDICLAGLVLWTPAGRRFWREHPRLRLLPEREVEAAGRAAIVTTYESVTDGARYEVVSARDSFLPLGVHGA